MKIFYRKWSRELILGMLFCGLVSGVRAEISKGVAGFESVVSPFFEEHCVACHGAEKSKGEITLHSMDGDLSAGQEMERWELIMEMLESGEMPPEEEEQPEEEARQAVARWIGGGLRDYVATAQAEEPETRERRLTNLEFENTLRDLLGVDLKLVEELPQDPVKPYRFNNTAEFLLLGPEQIDRYLKAARRAMGSAIVDPERPEVHKQRQEWSGEISTGGHGLKLPRNEIAIQNSGRGTPGAGMGLKSFPRTGEFRIRMQASAILPEGVSELPLRVVMGYNLNVNSSTLEVEPVGIVSLRNGPEDPRVYELRGRIENFPVQVGRVHRGKLRPDTLTITPQNNYDDGTLNDDNRFLYWPRQLEMPRVVMDWMEFEGPVFDVWPPEHHTRILFESPLRESDPEAYVREVLERFMSRAYRRPATEEEVANFVRIHGLIASEVEGFEAAMRETLSMVLVSPQFLMHTMADGEVVTEGYELASMLSYFLWASMPDEELLELAAGGKLNDPVVIGEQVRRLLRDPRSEDFVRNFTMQWLSLEKMKTVPINADLFPRFLYYVEAGERKGTEEPYLPTIRDHMLEETVGFVGELIRRNASVLNVVDSDFAMLNQPLAAHYGVRGVQGAGIRPVPVEKEHRLGGLLTQGSVLIGNGTGSAPHPIYRAVWLREAILGDEVKPPPAEVPALTDSAGDSAETALTIKDLLAKHRQEESCRDCHVRLDPWGIPFERYNAVGRYQEMVPREGTRVRGFNKEKDGDLAGYGEYLKSVNTELIEASARVPHGPEVKGMEDLKAYLLKRRQDDIAENVLRRLLSYGLGRELTYRDRFKLEAMAAELKEDGYLMEDMIVAICQSESFRKVSQP